MKKEKLQINKRKKVIRVKGNKEEKEGKRK